MLEDTAGNPVLWTQNRTTHPRRPSQSPMPQINNNPSMLHRRRIPFLERFQLGQKRVSRWTELRGTYDTDAAPDAEATETQTMAMF